MLFCSTWAWAYDCTVDWAMASGLGPLGILVSAQGSKSAGLNLAFGSITSGAEVNVKELRDETWKISFSTKKISSS